MSLPISTLQSLISRNRNEINSYHCMENVSTVMRDAFQGVADGCAAEENENVQYAKRQISKLAKIQCQLKKELAYAISLQRAERLVSSGWLKEFLPSPSDESFVVDTQGKIERVVIACRTMAAEASRIAEEKGKAAKDLGMNMNGEMY